MDVVTLLLVQKVKKKTAARLQLGRAEGLNRILVRIKE